MAMRKNGEGSFSFVEDGTREAIELAESTLRLAQSTIAEQLRVAKDRISARDAGISVVPPREVFRGHEALLRESLATIEILREAVVGRSEFRMRLSDVTLTRLRAAVGDSETNKTKAR